MCTPVFEVIHVSAVLSPTTADRILPPITMSYWPWKRTRRIPGLRLRGFLQSTSSKCRGCDTIATVRFIFRCYLSVNCWLSCCWFAEAYFAPDIALYVLFLLKPSTGALMTLSKNKRSRPFNNRGHPSFVRQVFLSLVILTPLQKLQALSTNWTPLRTS